MWLYDIYIGSRFCCRLSFFFQAEDGIRYLVRSRGLGDVYKRQDYLDAPVLRVMGMDVPLPYAPTLIEAYLPNPARAVSYTHLTLPTSDLV